ncbi:MAG: FMN-binding protein [Lachnospiraceae bacterium]|nr:FMN-binding protein [Lachnospiraceae bacterium]
MNVKKILKEAAILFVITLVSGLLLGFAYQVTKTPIAERQAREKREAYQGVFPDAADFAEEDTLNAKLGEAEAILSEAGVTGVAVNECLAAKDGSGQVLGYVMSLSFAGSQGEITMAYGWAMDGSTMGIDILQSSETANLGSLADEPEFKDQFAQNTEKFALGDNIDQISGATVTSDAVVNAANGGMAFATACAKGE